MLKRLKNVSENKSYLKHIPLYFVSQSGLLILDDATVTTGESQLFKSLRFSKSGYHKV